MGDVEQPVKRARTAADPVVFCFKRPLLSGLLPTQKLHMGFLIEYPAAGQDGKPMFAVLQVQGAGTDGSAQQIEYLLSTTRTAAVDHARAHFTWISSDEASWFTSECVWFELGATELSEGEMVAAANAWCREHPIYNFVKASCRTFAEYFMHACGFKVSSYIELLDKLFKDKNDPFIPFKAAPPPPPPAAAAPAGGEESGDASRA